MKKNKHLVPKRRFNEFENDGEWEKRELNEITNKITEKNTARKYQETFTNSAEFGIVSQSDYFSHNVSNKQNIHGYYVIRDNEFVYNPRISMFAPVGPINRNKLGRPGVMSPLYLAFKTNDINNCFLEYYFESSYWHSFMRLNGDTGARSDRFAIKDTTFFQMPIPYPDRKEQFKIAGFLSKLDKLIILQKRKVKKISNLKKAYVLEMFPKEGKEYPRIRFDGFTKPWKEYRLGDLSNIVRGASPRPIQDPKWFDSNSSVGWLRISDVTEQDGRIHYLEQKISKAGQEKTRVLKSPHLLLSIAATVGKPVINYIHTGVHDGFLIFMEPKFKQEFMYQWLEMFRVKWQKYGQPGSQVNLNSDIVKNQNVMIPSEKEQIKIGNFFKNLDKQIALEEKKLTKLEQLKQAYLNELFV